MTRKMIITISLVFILILLGGGALFFTGALDFSAVLAPPSPTAALVSLPSMVETVATGTPPPLPTATPIPPPSPTPLEPAATATPASPATLSAVQAKRQVQPAAAGRRAVETDPGQAEGLTGRWAFNFGVMTLAQNGVGVSGTYHWYGGQAEGQIKGTVIYESNQFSGLWLSQNNPNEQGFLKWRIVEDRAVTGTFENNGLKGQWCGVRAGHPLPAGCGFSGLWNFHRGSGNVGGRAQLVQTGDKVTGVYTTESGQAGQIVEAGVTILSMTEATLQGTWREASGKRGQFEWRLDQTTNQTFEGRNLDGNSEWCGWREGAGRPDPCGF